MISFPDFKEKRILFILAEYGYDNLVHLKNDNIRFVRNDEIVDQISCHIVFAVFIVGELSITSTLLKKLASHGISVFFLNRNLAVKTTMMNGAEGNYILRQKQYTSTNHFAIATYIVRNKISNQEAVLQKCKKTYDKSVFEHARNLMEKARDIHQLLGIEGNVSKTYFQSLFMEIGWHRRAPQTKEDINNLLLDIGYTYLFNFCDALLRLFGFDTYKGYYHQLFFQRKSLVCDVIEPLRPIIDSQLLKSFHLKQIHEEDFIFQNGRFEFKKGFKGARTYSSLFLQTIHDHKKGIYEYILGFYRHIMNDTKYQFQVFDI